MENCTVIAVANQKGGVGKTTTTFNLGVGLVRAGERVLLIDADPQGSLSISMGFKRPDQLPFTLPDALKCVCRGELIPLGTGILHHPDGIDLMPSNIELSAMEVSMVNVMSRETILKRYIDQVKGEYTKVLIDCPPSLNLLTINCLAAADCVLIPVQSEYLPIKGLEQLIGTIKNVRRIINPQIVIEGVVLTMVNPRTIFCREASAAVRNSFGSKITIFNADIPHSVRAKECCAEGVSIFTYDPNGKVAAAYEKLAREVMLVEKQRQEDGAALNG